jgi:hypothetical protein
VPGALPRRVSRSFFRISVLASVVGLASATLAGQRPPNTGAGITVFEDTNFGGSRATFVRDTPDLRPSHFDKRISSIVIGPGEMWEVCDGRDYAGRCEAFSGEVPDLVRRNWNDKIQSLRLVRSGGSGNRNARIELFAGTQYTGQRIILNGPTPDFSKGDVKFNDRAMSVRVPAGQSWEICVGANYDDCRVINRDVPDLSTLGISRVVSSARPHFGREP